MYIHLQDQIFFVVDQIATTVVAIAAIVVFATIVVGVAIIVITSSPCIHAMIFQNPPCDSCFVEVKIEIVLDHTENSAFRRPTSILLSGYPTNWYHHYKRKHSLFRGIEPTTPNYKK